MGGVRELNIPKQGPIGRFAALPLVRILNLEAEVEFHSRHGFTKKNQKSPIGRRRRFLLQPIRSGAEHSL